MISRAITIAAVLLASCAAGCFHANAATPAAGGAAAPRHVADYARVFLVCDAPPMTTRLAIRSMALKGERTLLLVDPETLKTYLEPAKSWRCADDSDESESATRFLRAIDTPPPAPKPGAISKPYLRNAGVTHGAGDGSFITGDLCPSSKPLDRPFIEALERVGPGTPISLSISGLWLKHHADDFQWLQEQARAGGVDITWVNHSFSHPYFPGRPFEENFLLAPGVDMEAEILDTEKALIDSGGTPSVFFRFPGLISNPALMDILRRDHLIALGADGWLVFAPPLRPGAIVLVHPNGNEPQGLRIFAKMMASDRLPRPFRAIDDAPGGAKPPLDPPSAIR